MQNVLVTLNPLALAAFRGSLAIRPGIIDVWAFSLQGPEECINWCRQWLSGAERDRADRFIFERDRNEFVVAHGIMRHLLAQYCGAPANGLRFSAGPAGKPVLETRPASDCAISFNLTHSHGRALLAVSDGREVGIDLEAMRSGVQTLAIARSYFFGSELAAIESCSPDEQHCAFFRHWVAKEAVLKAQGIGLGFPLDRFHVEFLPDEGSASVVTFDRARLSAEWRVRMLPCEPGWFAAVAAKGGDWSVHFATPAST